jgi:hypothetical protein
VFLGFSAHFPGDFNVLSILGAKLTSKFTVFFPTKWPPQSLLGEEDLIDWIQAIQAGASNEQSLCWVMIVMVSSVYHICLRYACI